MVVFVSCSVSIPTYLPPPPPLFLFYYSCCLWIQNPKGLAQNNTIRCTHYNGDHALQGVIGIMLYMGIIFMLYMG